MNRTIGIIALSTVALVYVSQAAGFYPNLSSSAPIGIWSKRPIPEKLHRGMMIWICPPSTVPVVKRLADAGALPYGACPESNVALLLKPVAAVPGDTVQISHGSPVKVNGKPLDNTISSETLPAWPDGEYIVQPGEVWVFSSYNEKSFDSRYYGPVSMNLVKGEAVPLLVN
jgi:conjugative transfer signal peptidase TraF